MTHRQRRLQRRAHRSVGRKVLLAVCVLFAIVGIAAASAGVWVLDVAAEAPAIDSLKPASSGESSQVFAADGTSLGYVQSTILRTQVGLGEIPKQLQEATIAIEDSNFYNHSGVDYGAIVRAALSNIEAGHVEQGASTITQQLVRNLYIPDPQDTLKRKIIEAKMAMEYEQEYTKDQILKRYLNTASYGTNDGRTAVGVEAASQVFFSKHVSDLSLEQSALLAGLPQAPSDYNPFNNPKGAKQRRNEVLDALAAQGYVTPVQADKAKARGLELDRGYKYESRSQQYFFDFVQQELIDKYGLETAREGGLKVYTTLDPHLQQVAEDAIAAHPVTGAAEALVSVDAQTGEIQAMASSESYEDSQFNLAAQGRRQPGSSFKPYALAAAVNEGIDPATTYYSVSSQMTLFPDGPLGTPWPVASDASGTMNLSTALAQSVNGVYAQLAIDIGPAEMDDMAHKLGVTSPLSGYASDVLGTSDVTVLDQASAYATFADGGVHHTPTAIAKVVFPDGHSDEPAKAAGNRVLSPGVAYVMEDVMRGPLDYGTAACCDIPCPASGKTGTTESQADAWFVGYTPHLSTAVWVGNPDDRTPMPGYGADLAAPIWHDYMEVAAAKPCDDYPVPATPADLSAHFSQYTADPNANTTTDGTTKPNKPTDTNGDGAPDPTTPAGGDTTNYDPNLYAPGAGQDPAPPPPTPGGDNGGGDTGGGGTGPGANGGGIHP
jgi:penicillin-binding protein 1A